MNAFLAKFELLLISVMLLSGYGLCVGFKQISAAYLCPQCGNYSLMQANGAEDPVTFCWKCSYSQFTTEHNTRAVSESNLGVSR